MVVVEQEERGSLRRWWGQGGHEAPCWAADGCRAPGVKGRATSPKAQSPELELHTHTHRVWFPKAPFKHAFK